MADPKQTKVGSFVSPKDLFPPELLAALVKSHLRIVILAYLLEEPRTGKDLKDEILKDTGISISPGRIYPLLHTMENQLLLMSLRGARQIIYRPSNYLQMWEQVRQYLEALRKLTGFLDELSNNGRPPALDDSPEGSPEPDEQ